MLVLVNGWIGRYFELWEADVKKTTQHLKFLKQAQSGWLGFGGSSEGYVFHEVFMSVEETGETTKCLKYGTCLERRETTNPLNMESVQGILLFCLLLDNFRIQGICSFSGD